MAFWGSDPECGRPPELKGLSAEELDALSAPAGPLEAWPTTSLPGDGAGFADGGPLDLLPPGVALAEFADAAHGRLATISDDELIGVLRAWRRQTSWAQARELAVVAELARRRPHRGAPPAPGQPPAWVSEFTADEIAAALTLTSLAAHHHLDLALSLAERQHTAAALAAGQLDLPRVRVILTALDPLAEDHAAAVEAAVLPKAPGLTTGQLRAAVAKAVLAVDPQAARKQREQAEKDARVECWTGPAGTATLAGRDLPPAQTLAADKRLSAIAKAWKKLGAAGGMDLLRAHAYLALLLGQDVTVPPASLLPPAAAPAPGRPGSPAPVPPGLRRLESGLPPLAGSITLTVPLTTLLGLADAPGEVPGYGPLDPGTARTLACAAAGHSASRWHITITAPGGVALAHGTDRRLANAAADGTGWTVQATAEPIAAGTCDHHHGEAGYEPSPALQQLVRARALTCSFPGCRRPAAGCDLDHSLAYDDGGITFQCNLSPLCRFHHRLKQSEGWTLTQSQPGVMTWITPARRRHTTRPTQY